MRKRMRKMKKNGTRRKLLKMELHSINTFCTLKFFPKDIKERNLQDSKISQSSSK